MKLIEVIPNISVVNFYYNVSEQCIYVYSLTINTMNGQTRQQNSEINYLTSTYTDTSELGSSIFYCSSWSNYWGTTQMVVVVTTYFNIFIQNCFQFFVVSVHSCRRKPAQNPVSWNLALLFRIYCFTLYRSQQSIAPATLLASVYRYANMHTKRIELIKSNHLC